MKQTKSYSLSARALAMVIAALGLNHSWAATALKQSTGTDLNGTTSPYAWSGGSGANGSPGASDIATWNSSSLGAGLALGAAASWGGISISGALSGVGITGAGTLTLGASGIDMSASTVSMVMANPITLGANQVWTVNSGRGLTNSGVISGSSRVLSKAGAGTLTLSAANSFSGGLTVSNGTVVGAVTGAFGATSGTINVYTNATLVWSMDAYNSFPRENANVIGGTLSFNSPTKNNHWIANPITLQGGTITSENGLAGPANDGTFGILALNQGGSVVVRGSAQSTICCTTVSSGTSLAPAPFFDVGVTGAGVDLLVSSVIRNNAGFPTAIIKTGAGTMEITGTNSWSGTTAINGGTLKVTSNLPNGAGVSVASNATLLVLGTVGTGGVTINNATLAGSGIIASPVTVQRGGTLKTDPSSISTLTISNAVTMLAGSTNSMKINSSTLTCDLVQGMAGFSVNGAALTLRDLGSGLAAGQTYTLFSLASGAFSGAFASLSLPALPAGLSWDVSQLTVNGTISVVGGVAAPIFYPAAGGYVGTQTVYIISSLPGATIYYTTDGSTPDGSSPSGPTPVTINLSASTNLTIRAYAHAAGYPDSAVVSATYYTQPTAIWINPAGGSWAAPNNWSNTVVGFGIGSTSDFSQMTLSGDAVVTLDSFPTVGTLLFGDLSGNNNWFINTGSGGNLTLDAGTNAPMITVSNQTTTIGPLVATSRGLVKDGSGVLVLTAANLNYAGNTVVNGGQLQVGSPGYLATSASYSGVMSVAAGASLDFNTSANQTLSGALSGLGTLAHDNSGNLTLTGNPRNFSGTYLNNRGNLYIAVSNSSAGLVLNNGYVVLGASGAIGTKYQIGSLCGSGGTVCGAQNGSGIFTLEVGALNVSTNFDGALQDKYPGDTAAHTLALTKVGTGTLRLAGSSTYSGATIVRGGTLLVSGSLGNGNVTVATNATLCGSGTVGGSVKVQNGGTLTTDPSGISTLMINGALLTAGNVNVRINSDTSSGDQLQGMTSVTYGGTLTVTDLGSSRALGQKFTLFSSYGPYSGNFATVNLPTPPSGARWDTSSLTIDGSIQLLSDNQTLTPAFNPGPGSQFGPLSVTISSDTGSTIHYTTDGSDPTTSGTVVAAASPVTVNIPVNSSETLRAYASKTGYANSPSVSAAYTTTTSPVWVATAGGSWQDPSAWSNNIVANGIGVSADFSQLTLPGNATVTLDSAPTIGSLSFGDAGNLRSWTINSGTGGNPLTLDAGFSTPTITVSNQITTIGAVLVGNSGLIKNGNGTLLIAANSYLPGETVINGGTLALSVNNGAFDRSMLQGKITVNAGGILAATNQVFGFGGGLTNIDVNGGTILAAPANNGLGTFGIVYNLVAGTVGGPGRIDLGTRNGVDGAINSVASSTPSIVGCTSGVLLRPDSGQKNYIFTVARGTTPSGIDLQLPLIANNGAASITKAGPGTLLLTNANTYTGGTTNSDGKLLVNGSLASGTVTVTGGTLGGNGTINGPVTVQSGGALQTDMAGIGTLTISNTLTLAGSVTLRVNRTALTNDLLKGITTLTYGGNLTVTNLAGTLAQGDSIKLFSAKTYTGGFASFNLPPLTGLAWDTSSLAVDGTLRVVIPQPSILPVYQTGTNLVIRADSTVVGRDYVLKSTLGLEPTPVWVPVQTNAGTGAPLTNWVPVDPAKAKEFFRYEVR